MTENPENEIELKDIPASKILDKIQKGEDVEYDHVILKDDLNISELNLPKENEKSLVKSPIKITNSRIEGDVAFVDIICISYINFESTHFGGAAKFGNVTFRGGVRFIKTTFAHFAGFSKATFNRSDKTAGFFKAKFCGDVFFQGTTFCGNADFTGATFNRTADFKGTTFNATVRFNRTTFREYAGFNGAIFSNYAPFNGATFGGDVLTFRDAIFKNPSVQEEACRRAKNVLEKNGNREDAGYHFYREMEGKRKQKSWYIRYIEWIFIQLIFGYGVHPFWLIYWWLLIVVAFSFVYSNGNGIDGIEQWYDYIKISFATAIAPGYIAVIINPASAGYKLIPAYQVVAMIETIVGTFLWAGFIATFAKKYMK